VDVEGLQQMLARSQILLKGEKNLTNKLSGPLSGMGWEI
jgi:hypothetical protein